MLCLEGNVIHSKRTGEIIGHTVTYSASGSEVFTRCFHDYEEVNSVNDLLTGFESKHIQFVQNSLNTKQNLSPHPFTHTFTAQ